MAYIIQKLNLTKIWSSQTTDVLGITVWATSCGACSPLKKSLLEESRHVIAQKVSFHLSYSVAYFNCVLPYYIN